MDSITHIALGAVIGEGLAGKTLGKRAMVFGALAQSLPDMDFIAALWTTPTENALAHRGFTHSFLFAIIATVFLSLLGERMHRPFKFSLKQWMLFLGTEIFVHLFIDAFNAYGVGWFEPFSRLRFSFHTLFVADPFFSIWIGVAVVVLIIIRSRHRIRKWWVAFGLGMCSLYVLYAINNKLSIDREVRTALHSEGINYLRYFTTPTPFNNWLWYVVVEEDRGYHIAHRSVFDKGEIDFYFFPRDSSLLTHINQPDIVALQQLFQFSQGYYTVEKWGGDTLVFNDLRFGQIVGWHNPHERFVFHYFLNHPDQNALVLQRGRFAKWNPETIRSLIRRIRGDRNVNTAASVDD